MGGISQDEEMAKPKNKDSQSLRKKRAIKTRLGEKYCMSNDPPPPHRGEEIQKERKKETEKDKIRCKKI